MKASTTDKRLFAFLLFLLWLMVIPHVYAQAGTGGARMQTLLGTFRTVPDRAWERQPDGSCIQGQATQYGRAVVGTFESLNHQGEIVHPFTSTDLSQIGYRLVPRHVESGEPAQDFALDLSPLTDPGYAIGKNCVQSGWLSDGTRYEDTTIAHSDRLCAIHPASHIKMSFMNHELNPDAWNLKITSVCFVTYAAPRLLEQEVYSLSIDLSLYDTCDIPADKLQWLPRRHVVREYPSCLNLWDGLRDALLQKLEVKRAAAQVRRSARQGFGKGAGGTVRRAGRKARRAARRGRGL